MLLLFGDITHSEATYTYVLVLGAMLVFLKCQKEANFAWILYHLIVNELCSNLTELFDLRIFVILTNAYVQTTPQLWFYGFDKVRIKVAFDFEAS